jgi:exopolysaccharide biosynthesis polyprenyl glycosylphosphotransferase
MQTKALAVRSDSAAEADSGSPQLGFDAQAGDVRTDKTASNSVTRVIEAEWAPGLFCFLCDVVCWMTLYYVVSSIRHDAFYSSGLEFALLDLFQLVVIVQALFIIGGYSSRTETRGLTYTAEHILAILSAFLISSLIIYTAATFDEAMKPSRSAILVSFIVFTPLSLLYRRALRRQIATASASRAFLVIGAGDLASDFYRIYRGSPNPQRLEFVDPNRERAGKSIAGPGTPIVESDLASKLGEASMRYSGIILAESLERISPQLIDALVRAQFQRTRVYTLESFYEAHWRHVPMHSIDPFWPLQTGFQLSRNSPYHYVKRLFDLVVSAVLLVISSPLWGLIALLIGLTSGRPIIFKQQRVGRDDRVFTLYKFRTMKEKSEVRGQMSEVSVDGRIAEAESEEIYTLPNDPRVLRLGRWLRKLRLDELPQLWNVLAGEMSLIGPRAEWVKCVERYEKAIPFYHFRHLVKPGITGWAQVNYPYGESEQDAIEKLKYDLYYIRHYSLKLDAMIVLKTVHTMLFGKGR